MSAEPAWLRALPKVDTHCHLDGSLRVRTILELAKKQRVRLPADTEKELRRFVTVSPSCRSLKEFIDAFDIYLPLLRDPESVERVAYELCEDSAADNIRHVEVRDAPVIHAHADFTAEQFVEAALRGLRRGLRDFGVTSSFIVGLFRAHSPRENRVAFEALVKFFRPANGLREPGVVGMDLCGDEARFPTMEFAAFYERASARGIPTTCHAGETVGTENLRAALALGVRRIGHGTRLLEDAVLLRQVVERKIPLEIGITSNLRTVSVRDLASHPVKKFYDAGVPLSINTDDRGLIDIDLTHEYRIAHELGFSRMELTAIARGAIDHLFLPENDRRELAIRFDAELAAFGVV